MSLEQETFFAVCLSHGELSFSGNVSSLEDRLCHTLQKTILEMHRHREQQGFFLDWRWHRLVRHRVEGIRMIEFKKGQNVMQMVVRIDSEQVRQQNGVVSVLV